MKQEHEMTPGVLVSGDDMSAGDYKARCAVLEAEMADHERLQAETERLQAARAAGKARIAELESALGDLLAIVSDSTGVVGYHLNGAVAEWGDFDVISAASAALARHGKESN